VQSTYFEPTTIVDAVEILDAEGIQAGVVAGGTDLVVANRMVKRRLPSALVAIHRITEMRGIVVETEGSLRLGALVTYADIEASQVLRSDYSALADAAALVGSPATRHIGTVGGNLCNGSPAMESGGPLLCFNASVELASRHGTRTISLVEFLTGPGTTTLAASELLAAVLVPPLPSGDVGSAYLRLEYRRAMEIAVVGATALVTLDANKVLSEVRLALTAVAPTCIRVPAAEGMLRGHAPTAALFAEAGRVAADAARPIDDVRAPAAYRRAMVPVLVGRALELAVRRARREELPFPAARAFD